MSSYTEETPWMPAPGRHRVNVGSSLNSALKARKGVQTTSRRSNLPVRDFYSFRYNFKPPSVDVSRPGNIEVTKKKDLTSVSVEHPSSQPGESHVFSGSENAAKDVDCVLIYDEETGTFTLEKLDSYITLQHEKRTTSSLPVLSAVTPAASTPEYHAPTPRSPVPPAPETQEVDEEGEFEEVIPQHVNLRQEEEEEDEEGEITSLPPRQPTPPPPRPPPPSIKPARAKPKPSTVPRPQKKREAPVDPAPVATPIPSPPPSTAPAVSSSMDFDVEEEVLQFGKPTRSRPRTAPSTVASTPAPSSSFSLALPSSSTSVPLPPPLREPSPPPPVMEAIELMGVGPLQEDGEEEEEEEEEDWVEVPADPPAIAPPVDISMETEEMEMDMDAFENEMNDVLQDSDVEDFLTDVVGETSVTGGREESEGRRPMSMNEFAANDSQQEEEDYSSSDDSDDE